MVQRVPRAHSSSARQVSFSGLRIRQVVPSQ
jgi:hypothetical protein